jgi:hypothetical protein
MNDETDLTGTRALLRDFDLGPLPPLDLDDVVRRGHRRRRAAGAQRIAVVAAVVLVVAAGFANLHTRFHAAPPPVSTVTPTPSPSTAAERVTAVMNAVATAESVHVVARISGGSTLDVVVTKAGAIGTWTYQGKTAEYLGVDGALYMKGDALSGSVLLALPIQDSQVAAGHGRWFRMTSMGPSTFMNLTELSRWFYPPHGSTATLGQTRTIDGTPTIALTEPGFREFNQYVELDSPYRPVLVETPNQVFGWAFSDWDATAPILPPAPDPADVYDPSQG